MRLCWNRSRRTLRQLVIIPTVFLSCSCARLPEYQVRENKEDVIDNVSIGLSHGPLFGNLNDGLEKESKLALGRTYRQLDHTEVSKLRVPTKHSETLVAHALRGKYFDLWSAVERLQRDPEPAVPMIEFELIVEEGQSPYLGIGCADGVAVFVNDRAEFAVCGSRESRYTHHIVRLPVRKGMNHIKIAFEKAKPWTIPPAEHWDNEWSVNLQIFGGINTARKFHAQRVAHPLDTPIVQQLEDILVEACWGENCQVALFDKNQRQVARGKTLLNGRIEWESNSIDLSYPFIGILTIENVGSEPILLCGMEPISSALRGLGKSFASASGPWAYRVQHLLKPEYEKNRDAWWSRKFVMSAVKILFAGDQNEKSGIVASCRSMQLELASFRSRIDGTEQYYRYFRNNAVTGPRRVLVIVPTVPTPVRPFLESYTLADLNSAEALVGVARAAGIDLLWTGGACVDYGGTLARTDVIEAWEDFENRFPAKESDMLFVMGSCSAGVTALGSLLQGLPADGAVLWSPSVHRRTYRWKPGQDTTQELPSGVLDAEQTDTELERYLQTRFLMYYDNDAEGHGNRALAKKFQSAYLKQGGIIENVWVEPAERILLWGVRERISVEEWMLWIANFKKSKPTDLRSEPPNRNSFKVPSTVKDALLHGMIAEPEFLGSRYGAQWLKMIGQYRGKIPLLIGDAEGKTKLALQRTSAEEISNIFEDDRDQISLLPKTNLRDKQSSTTETKLWGFKLVFVNQKPSVVIFTNLEENEDPPPIDLLVEGCCRAAVWSRDGNTWKIRQLYVQQSQKQ